MSALVFERGIVRYTFLVTTAPETLREQLLTRYPNELDNLTEEDKQEAREMLDNPQFLAQTPVSDLFDKIIERNRPQGVTVTLGFEGKESDAPRIAPVRQKIESGELSGQLVTIRLGFTRDKGPFPGLGWLTNQVPEEPGNGMIFLYSEAMQLPS